MKSVNLVDWVSFVVPVSIENVENKYDVSSVVWDSIRAFLGQLWTEIDELTEGGWSWRKGRSPYNVSFHCPRGITVFGNLSLDHALVEISGAGCRVLSEAGLMLPLLKKAQGTSTRVDVATDIETGVRPTDFVDAGVSKKFRSRGVMVSETGETVYVGSKKSSRYCRVYRYEKPHPRHRYMRIEYVYRKEESRRAISRILHSDVDTFAGGSAKLFDWGHGLMSEKKENIDMTAYRPERRSGKTLRWIIAQVAPAFKKLVREGVIERPRDFVEEYFLEGSEDEG